MAEEKEKMEAAEGDDLMQKSAYYSHDNAIFRQRPGSAGMAVDDVLHGNKFVPYKGDRVAPVMRGSKIKLARVLKVMKG